MRRFSINLATRPFRNNTIYWIGLVLCIAGLSFFTWFNVNLYERSGRDTEHWEEVMEGHRAALLALDKEVRTMKSEVADIDLEAFGERSEFANKIIMSRLFSWTSLFDRLEEIQPPKVRLRSIRPSITKTGVEIGVDGLTPDPKALLEFEDALMKSKYFNFVFPHLESEQVKKSELNFSLSFGYDAEAGEGPKAGAPAAGEAGQGKPAEAGTESPQGPATGEQASAPAEGAPGAPPASAPAESAAGGASEAPEPAAAAGAPTPQGAAPGAQPATQAGGSPPPSPPAARPGKAGGRRAHPGKAGGRIARPGKAEGRITRPAPGPSGPAAAPAPPPPAAPSPDPNDDPNDADPNDADPNGLMLSAGPLS